MKEKELIRRFEQLKKRFSKPKATGSEFGKGLIYPLVLFAMHMDMAVKMIEEYKRIRAECEKPDFVKGVVNLKYKGKKVRTMPGEFYIAKSKQPIPSNLFTEGRALSMWMNGASDHLYDIVIPKKLPASLAKRVIKLREKALYWGHGGGMMKDMPLKEYQAIRAETEEIAYLLDRWLGIQAIKAEWN